MNRVYRLCILCVITISLLLAGRIWHIASSLVAGSWFGAFLVYMGTRPGWRRTLVTLLIGLGTALLSALLGTQFASFRTSPVVSILGIGAFLGIGSILVLSYDIVWLDNGNHSVLRTVLVLPVFSCFAGLCMALADDKAHKSFDYMLYAFDATLKLTPGRSVTDLFDAQPWVQAASSAVYSLLAIFPPLFHAWATFTRTKTTTNLMYAFVVAGVLGFALYHICPAMGPVYAFPAAWPKHLPSSVPFTEIPTVSFNNAMPSLHMTWALLVWWAAWDIGSFAVVVATVFVGFTGLATVGLGEHYLIDLVVAGAVVIATQGICSKRHMMTVVGLGLAVGWTTVLRFGTLLWLPAIDNWILVFLTLATTAFLMRPDRGVGTPKYVRNRRLFNRRIFT